MASGMRSNCWAISSLITGVLSFLIPPLGVLLSVSAVITGYIGQKRRKYRWMAHVGIFLGVVYWVLLIIGILTGALGNLFGMLGF